MVDQKACFYATLSKKKVQNETQLIFSTHFSNSPLAHHVTPLDQ